MNETMSSRGGETSGEKSSENSTNLEILTEMSGKFDPDKARTLVERDRQKEPEMPSAEAETETDETVTHLAVIAEQKEKVLSPEDAANEYLSLLDELSQDFLNPCYSDERKGQSHYANNITTDLGLKYSDNPHYRWRGYASTEAGATDGTMLRIASADCILANEIGWRNGGEKVGEIIEQVDKKIADLDAEYSKKGRLGKFFGKKGYEQARKDLERSKNDAEFNFSRRYNANIAKELAISYNEKGNYDYGNGDYGQSQNESRNRQFFGLDDPERAKKVERAIELRQKYETEWAKDKATRTRSEQTAKYS